MSCCASSTIATIDGKIVTTATAVLCCISRSRRIKKWRHKYYTLPEGIAPNCYSSKKKQVINDWLVSKKHNCCVMECDDSSIWTRPTYNIILFKSRPRKRHVYYIPGTWYEIYFEMHVMCDAMLKHVWQLGDAWHVIAAVIRTGARLHLHRLQPKHPPRLHCYCVPLPTPLPTSLPPECSML